MAATTLYLCLYLCHVYSSKLVSRMRVTIGMVRTALRFPPGVLPQAGGGIRDHDR